MKLAFLFGPLPVGDRPLDFSAIETSDRGLTTARTAHSSIYTRPVHERGHEVVLHVDKQPGPFEWDGIDIRRFDSRWMFTSYYDAVLSWCQPELLQRCDPSSLRVCDQQLNNFDSAPAGFERHVDLFLAPSRSLADRLQAMVPGKSTWRVAPNGCDPNAYGGEKVPGRCVYTSSPDRGLHLVLQEWPKIRAAVPHATLRIFYHLDRWLRDAPHNAVPEYSMRERAQRAKYINAVLSELKKIGVEVVGSVSRKRLAAELSAAEVLAFPCDTIAYTEGFSVATLEGCASGALPIITDIDALGSIYGGSVPMVAAEIENRVSEWSDFVVRTLTDAPWAAEWRRKAGLLADRHAWPVLAARLEALLEEGIARK